MRSRGETCEICGKPLIPDLDSKRYGTDDWDKHTWKFDCNCVNKDLRVAIG